MNTLGVLYQRACKSEAPTGWCWVYRDGEWKLVPSN